MKYMIIGWLLVGLLLAVTWGQAWAATPPAPQDFGQHCLDLLQHSDILRLWVVASSEAVFMSSLTIQWRSNDPTLPEPYQLIGLGALTAALPGADHAFEIRAQLTNHSPAFAGGEDCRLRSDLSASFAGTWRMVCRGDITLFDIQGTLALAPCAPPALAAALHAWQGLQAAGYDPAGYRP